jgi:hypothetical protein
MDTDAVAQRIRNDMLDALRALRRRAQGALASGHELDESFREHLHRLIDFTSEYVDD